MNRYRGTPFVFHRVGRRYETSCPGCGTVIVETDKPTTCVCHQCGYTGPAHAAGEVVT